MKILFIDTSSERGIIGCGGNNEILFSRELPFGLTQSKFLMPYLAEELKPFQNSLSFDAIGVGIGPGSYTGIRIGVAVAQTLAYCWKIPLVGISSLEGFICSTPGVSYLAIMDARIGGVYYQLTSVDANGKIQKSPPAVATLEEAEAFLPQATHLVTPYAKNLQLKLQQRYPENQWHWEERSPCSLVFLSAAEQAYLRKEIVIPPNHLNLLYLRKTEAERNRENLESNKN